jgi:hypothetical protein
MIHDEDEHVSGSGFADSVALAIARSDVVSYTLSDLDLRLFKFLEVFGQSGASFFRPFCPLAKEVPTPCVLTLRKDYFLNIRVRKQKKLRRSVLVFSLMYLQTRS